MYRTLAATGVISMLLTFACAGGTTPSDTPQSNDAEPSPLEGRAALLVVAPADFQDRELSGVQEALSGAGADLTIASTVTTEVTGTNDVTVTPSVTLADADVAVYNAVIFIGGPGTEVLLENTDAHALARATLEGGKLLAAICMAPEILANAGLLDGKRATCWTGGVENLTASGAIVVDEPVVVDSNIITGNGPDAAPAFGETIVEYLATH